MTSSLPCPISSSFRLAVRLSRSSAARLSKRMSDCCREKNSASPLLIWSPFDAHQKAEHNGIWTLQWLPACGLRSRLTSVSDSACSRQMRIEPTEKQTLQAVRSVPRTSHCLCGIRGRVRHSDLCYHRAQVTQPCNSPRARSGLFDAYRRRLLDEYYC